MGSGKRDTGERRANAVLMAVFGIVALAVLVLVYLGFDAWVASH